MDDFDNREVGSVSCKVGWVVSVWAFEYGDKLVLEGPALQRSELDLTAGEARELASYLMAAAPASDTGG